MKKIIYFSAVAMLAIAAATLVRDRGAAGQVAGSAPAFHANALLHVPAENFRRDWTLLGSYSVLADEPGKGAKELHVVYAKPQAVAHYRATGAFPDGAVLVKEVFAARTEALTTGIASYADSLIGRFVMVKDKENKYANTSALWGDGWGWAFYKGTETEKTITTDYRQDCLVCHEPARGQDLIYVQGYPVLRR